MKASPSLIFPMETDAMGMEGFQNHRCSLQKARELLDKQQKRFESAGPLAATLPVLFPKTKKQVQFSEATVYYHSIILGDNPSCAMGTTPISIDWTYFLKETVRLDGAPRDVAVTKKDDRKLSPESRFRIVRAAGYTMKEINKTKAACASQHKAILYNVRNMKKILSSLQRENQGKTKRPSWQKLIPKW